MAYNTFFINNDLTNFSEKKIVATQEYPKYFVRSFNKTLEDKNLNYVDTNDSSFIQMSKELKVGSSFYSNKKIFSHKFNSNLRFFSFFSFSHVSLKKSYGENLIGCLENLSKKSETVGGTLFLIKPVKGGFTGICNSFKGFIPRSQIKILYKKFFIDSLTKNRSKNSFFFFNFSKTNMSFLNYRLFIKLGSLILYPGSIKNAFSGKSKYHFMRFHAKFNFVFLCNKKEKKVFDIKNFIYKKRRNVQY